MTLLSLIVKLVFFFLGVSHSLFINTSVPDITLSVRPTPTPTYQDIKNAQSNLTAYGEHETFTITELSNYSKLLVAINRKVLDVTWWIAEHPGSFTHILIQGGYQPLLKYLGDDASAAFKEVGHSEYAYELLKDLQVGSVKNS